ncbi:histidine phosphatase family protein [Deinococcus arboris]|uniref:histidine phosphatase family protein n=1 Tax=Deinococcus arboris TaxID=2682977 RepID=UPI0021026818|nr:histidine phosphatase family protein [Deinococcus arboris]
MTARLTLTRARETAQVVTDALGLPLTPTVLLREWGNGPLAGMKRALVRSPVRAFQHDLEAFTTGVERVRRPSVRALLALDLVWRGGETALLAVTYGGFGKSLLRELLGPAYP